VLKQYSSPVPVISIGNILAGGTGKSPFTMYLIEKLNSATTKLAVVSRGYGRSTKGPVVVSAGNGNIVDAKAGGDEPVMIARRFPKIPVIVAKKRKSAIQIAVNDFDTNLILLDDAFQHRSVLRDLDILLLDVQRNPVNEPLLPAGDRREYLCAMHRADIIVYTKQQEHLNSNPFGFKDKYSATAFASGYMPYAFKDLRTGKNISLHEMSGKKAVAFCAIAQPSQFSETLAKLNISLSYFKVYPDHYAFQLKDFAYIRELADKYDCHFIITTEKDAVKMNAHTYTGFSVLVLEMHMALSDEDILLQKVKHHIDLAVKSG
jgi:tetraacyldisaccharide 4'-kinase